MLATDEKTGEAEFKRTNVTGKLNIDLYSFNLLARLLNLMAESLSNRSVRAKNKKECAEGEQG